MTKLTLQATSVLVIAWMIAATVTAAFAAQVGGKTAAGTLSAPNTLKTKESGLNLLVDIGKLN